ACSLAAAQRIVPVHPRLVVRNAAVHVDNLSPVRPDLSAMTQMTHEAMVARWQQGLVTPMSSTINTFAKTDGSWWTVSDGAWQRVPESARSEQLDYHHDRFAST